MKINISQIAPEGLTLEEDLPTAALDLEIDNVKFRGPVRIRAEVSKITNAVSVDLTLHCLTQAICSRCLNEFEITLNKKLRLNYPVNKQESSIDTSTSLSVNGERSRTIDLGPDIREEIILDYPFQPLCSPKCKGLCPQCGRNLNEGGCSCAITKKKTF